MSVTFPIGLNYIQPLEDVDYVYSMNGYRGRFCRGRHSVCIHEHKSTDAAVNCANKTAREFKRNGGIKL